MSFLATYLDTGGKDIQLLGLSEAPLGCSLARDGHRQTGQGDFKETSKQDGEMPNNTDRYWFTNYSQCLRSQALQKQSFGRS
jgi:hypothetical protein